MKENRERWIKLIEDTARETRSRLSRIDPEHIVHGGSSPWRVRDVLGHVGVWNGEAARSLRAHAQGKDYHCIEAEAKYDEYNGLAVDERRNWSPAQLWAEYDSSCSALISLVDSMPDDQWTRSMRYPWNEVGTAPRLIEIMMTHEVEHREVIPGY